MCVGIPVGWGSAIQYDPYDPQGLAKAQMAIAAMNAQASFSQMLYADDKPDHKRMTRRKWWLVRKAIPLPWVKR